MNPETLGRFKKGDVVVKLGGDYTAGRQGTIVDFYETGTVTQARVFWTHIRRNTEVITMIRPVRTWVNLSLLTDPI